MIAMAQQEWEVGKSYKIEARDAFGGLAGPHVHLRVNVTREATYDEYVEDCKRRGDPAHPPEENAMNGGHYRYYEFVMS